MHLFKKLSVWALSLCISFPTAGMLKTKTLFNKRTVAAAITVAAGYKFSDVVPDSLRIGVLQTPRFKTYLETHYNNQFDRFVVQPLQHSTHYTSMREATSESRLRRYIRGVAAKTLTASGYLLAMSNTESSLICNALNTKKLSKGRSSRLRAKKEHLATLDEIFSKEKEAQTRGEAVLYHATSPAIYGLACLGTTLDQTFVTRTIPKEYLKLRETTAGVDDVTKSKLITTQDKLKQLFTREHDDAIVRRKIMQCPGHDRFYSDDNLQDWLLHADDYNKFFSTYRLSCSDTFIPLQETDSCAGDFWFRNLAPVKGERIHKHVTTLLARYKVPDALKAKYAGRLADVIEQFETQQGTKDSANIMLQMTLATPLLDQASYPSFPGGLKRNVYKRAESGTVVNLPKTSDYLAQKSQNPFVLVDKGNNNSDNGGVKDMEYRLILSEDLLLNAEAVKGQFHVYAYTRHPEHIITFQKTMSEIVKSLEQDMSKK